MDYRKTAKEILNHVGGSKNIVSAAHCATRLRLVIADNTKADKTALENVDGVKGVFEASGQLQIILGTGTVNKVFGEFIAIAGITASTKAEAKEAAAEKQNWFMKAIKLLGDIFVPIIPAIVASGFLMGIMNALDFMNSNGFLHISTTSSIYVFATLFSNIAYTFLQILIAFSAAKAFGANPYLGAVIGMIMIHPSLQNAYTVATEGVQQTQSVFFGLYHIDMVGYQGHVIPVVIAVWILSILEKKLHKIVPEVLDLFVTPLVSVFVTGYLTLSIVGPIFVWAENAILGAIQWMLTLPLGLGSLIMGICTDRCYRYPSDVHSHRYRTACKIRCNLLAATRKCSKRGTGCGSTCRCCKIKRPKDQIPCTSIITQCIYGNYRTCNLWCKLKIL